MSASTFPSSSAARAALLQSLQDHLDQGGFEADLARRVAWQTESDGGQPTESLDGYLRQEIMPTLERMGFACHLYPNPDPKGGPLLIARRIEDAQSPTVLTYGHGDVINGQVGRWHTGLDPWTLQLRGDRWFGRGTADNKGQHSISLAALEHTLKARQGRLGYNMTVLFEMGEEAGSPGLHQFCAEHRDELRADVLLACDGPRVSARQPTLFLGSRGLVNFTLRVRSRDRSFHSGNWGGVLVNPATVLAQAWTALVDARGCIRVPELRPTQVSDEVKQALRHVPVGGAPEDPEVDPHWGEPGLTPIERLVAWNTLEILAFESGSPARPINAIPPTAIMHAQLRFVVGTPWQQLKDILRRHLDRAGFAVVDIDITATAEATRTELSNPWVDWASRSIQASSGKTAVILPNLAGTLPNDVFSHILGLPTLWVPHSYPACGQHAPNEHLLKDVAREGMQIMGGLYWDLGEATGVPWHARQ